MDNSTPTRSLSSPISGLFTFQTWPVYVEAISCAKELTELTKSLSGSGNASLCDQLKRASHSIALNIAEGSGRNSNKEKINFLRISKGSVFECVSVLDLVVQFEMINDNQYMKLQERLARLGKMLSGMIRHWESMSPWQ